MRFKQVSNEFSHFHLFLCLLISQSSHRSLAFPSQTLSFPHIAMPPRTKKTTSKGGSSSNPPRNPRKRPMVESPPRLRSKRNIGSFSSCRNATSYEHYQRIFSKRFIINERFVETETLCTSWLLGTVEGHQWLPIFSVNGLIQEVVVQIFYANFLDVNND